MEYIQEAKLNTISNLFFDEISKSVFYMHQDRLYISTQHKSLNLSPYSKDLSKPIHKASIDEPREILICEQKPNRLSVFGIKEISRNKINLKSPALGFHLARNRAVSWDLCVITGIGLEFFKLDEDLKLISKILIPLPISFYHFDVITGLIVLYSIKQALVYQTYLRKITLLSKYSMEGNIRELAGVNNLLSYNLPQLDSSCLMVASMYGKAYLLQLDGFSGVLTIYKKDKIKYELAVEPGAYSMRVIDSLIILQNYGLQESTIIDIFSNPPAFKLNHRGTFELNPVLILLSHQHALDLTEKKFLRFKIEPKDWVTQMPSLEYSVLFMLRRESKCEEALALLRQAITQKVNLTQVIHKIVKRLDKIPMLSQDLLYSKVFLVSYKEDKSSENLELTNALLAYIKELTLMDIPIDTSLEVLLIKALIRSGSYGLVQDLIHFKVITDSKDVAYLLFELSKRNLFPFGYLLGIDMLCRLNLYVMAMDNMILNGDMYETITMINNHPCPGYDVNKLNKDTADLYTNISIQEFLRDNIY
jgi:Colon cancer-associated protein Mic1-like